MVQDSNEVSFRLLLDDKRSSSPESKGSLSMKLPFTM